MLSDVIYPSLAGTSVPRDFVELPSQLYEHWQEQPQVLRQFAKHYQTGEPLPDDLLKAMAAGKHLVGLNARLAAKSVDVTLRAQATGAEVVHLGHNRSVREIVDVAQDLTWSQAQQLSQSTQAQLAAAEADYAHARSLDVRLAAELQQRRAEIADLRQRLGLALS